MSGYKRELRKPVEYDGRKNLYDEYGKINTDVPNELKEYFVSMGNILDAFNVPYLKKIVFCAMYQAYNINRV